MERNQNVKENFKAITEKIVRLPESIQATLFLFMVYHRNLIGYFWSEFLKRYPEICGGEWGNYDPQSFSYGYNFDKGCQEISVVINGKRASFYVFGPASQNIADWGYILSFGYGNELEFAVEEVKDDEPFIKVID